MARATRAQSPQAAPDCCSCRRFCSSSCGSAIPAGGSTGTCSFSNRIGVYLALMDDRYPSTEDEQAVRLDFAYPDARELNRWLPLVKWLLAIPHYIVLFFLYVGALFAVIGAWFAILFSGRYPRAIFDYVEGVIRWHNRVVGYALIL